jgi:hypothetical protein
VVRRCDCYASTKNLYAALDEVTGFTPDVIRSVDASHLQSLFEPIAADDWVPPLGHGAPDRRPGRCPYQVTCGWCAIPAAAAQANTPAAPR